MKRHPLPRAGFTLIELLIVVAIIAILAAIAVPNFLEAQVRAKVSRTKSDLRSLATALESYYIDNNAYPINNQLQNLIPNWWTWPQGVHRRAIQGYMTQQCFPQMTTPIAYISSVEAFVDVFNHGTNPDTGGTRPDFFGYYYRYHPEGTFNSRFMWLLGSMGPNNRWNPDIASAAALRNQVNPPYDPDYVMTPYDPTNGTVSDGNIGRWGP
jgi:type II secretion system protein G